MFSSKIQLWLLSGHPIVLTLRWVWVHTIHQLSHSHTLSSSKSSAIMKPKSFRLNISTKPRLLSSAIWKLPRISLTIKELFKSTTLNGLTVTCWTTPSNATLANAKNQPLSRTMWNILALSLKVDPSTTSNRLLMAYTHSNIPLSSRHTLTTIRSISSTWFPPPEMDRFALNLLLAITKSSLCRCVS